MPTIERGAALAGRTHPWLSGGGIMGERIRNYDWGATSLGPSDAWQQSLMSLLDLTLSTAFPMLIMSGPNLVQIYNDAYALLMADDDAEWLGLPARDRMPEFLKAGTSMLDRVLGGETVRLGSASEPIVRRGRGVDAWFNATLSPTRDDTGSISGVILVASEVTGHMLARRQLATELQHRVRNSLSVVRSIAHRTADNSASLDEFADHLDGRLAAFGRAQGAVVSLGSAGPDLHTIIVDELAAVVTQEGDRLTVSGPNVRLQPKAAETLGLAFHELATNSVKFGALGVEGGWVGVSWRFDGDGHEARLMMEWRENRPGPALSAPTHSGFGTEHLERTLDYELEAKTVLDYRKTGLQCMISVPLSTSVVADIE